MNEIDWSRRIRQALFTAKVPVRGMADMLHQERPGLAANTWAFVITLINNRWCAPGAKAVEAIELVCQRLEAQPLE